MMDNFLKRYQAWSSDMKRLGPAVLGTVFFWRIVFAGAGDVFVYIVANEQRVCPLRHSASAGRVAGLLAGRFKWTISPPLVYPVNRSEDPTYSVKDPTIVRYKDNWHLFCTIRGEKRSHQIEYLRFKDWNDLEGADRYVLKLSEDYFCAPEVFYFTPQKQWYMIYQVIDKLRKPALQPAYSTTRDIADFDSWSRPQLLFSKQPESVKRWIDFWVICDATRAHLFFTSLDGQMWRSQTKLSEFPGGWSQPSVVLRGDIFEASHTYYLKGLKKFLTVIEAQAGGRRYYKAYLAETLDCQWMPLAASKDRPFASPVNTHDSSEHWTDSFSHGELIRHGYDQSLTVDPADLRFLFQGISDSERKRKPYGQIPWRLGMLIPVR